MSRCRKKTRERRGRTGEKAGNHEQGPEENPGKKGTNQRKSRKSWAGVSRKPGEEGDESEKK